MVNSYYTGRSSTCLLKKGKYFLIFPINQNLIFNIVYFNYMFALNIFRVDLVSPIISTELNFLFNSNIKYS